MRKIAVICLSVIGLLVVLHLVLHRASQPYAVSHRGGAGLAPENTLAAIRAGIGTDAMRLEIDVQRSKDGVLLLHHDEKIPEHGPIADLDYETIRSVGVKGEPIPTLDETLALFADEAKPGQRLIIEGKAPKKYPGIAKEIVAAVDAHNLRDRVVFMSFDADFLREVHQLAPDAALGSIHFYPFSVPRIDGMESVGVFWGCAVIDPTLIPRLHRRGLGVNVWTLDSPFLIRLMGWLGADLVTTNHPEKFPFH